MAEGASRVYTHPHTGAVPNTDYNRVVRQVVDATLNASNTATSDIGANLRPSADPLGRHVAYATSLNRDGHILVGQIVDGSANANAYIVELERENCAIIAEALSQTSQSVIGATAFSSFLPGTRVLVYRHPAMPQAFILGAIPAPASKGAESTHDFISQTTRNRVDEADMRYLKMAGGSGIMNFSAWQPFDTLMASEWGAIATTGLGISLDDFMVKMSVNEFTGVFGFYHDSLLRVSGYNMQTWTAGHERDAYMDQAEYNDTQGYTPYPWEHMGSLKPGQNIIKEYSGEATKQASGYPYYGHWENKYDNQQPFHRTQKFYGYYGQGERTVVCAPPANASWWTYKLESDGKPPAPFESTVKNELSIDVPEGGGSDKETIDEEKPPIGLSEDNTGLDGRRFIASAKGISLVKRLLLPVPSRLRRPEDGNGDKDDNYKFAGKYGGGDAHKITGDLETSGSHPNLQRAAGVLDLHGYLFNYAGLHPFHWHAKDYKTWEQSELKYAEYNQAVPTYSELKGSMYLGDPEKKQLQIDHRYSSQNFYACESFINLLEDGGIVIGDGYGGEIRMTAGTVTISAPGDVWFKPGKNAQIWAGRDCIVRANNTVDISSTEENVRVKAEQNVMVLAGNDSSKKLGGVLIESRAKAAVYEFDEPGDSVVFGGVVLRAKKAEGVAHAKNIYMRTVGGFEGTDDPPGVITLDASRGQGTLMTKSAQIIHYIDKPTGQIFHTFRVKPDSDARVVSSFGKDQTFLNGGVFTDGPITADGKKEGFSFMARNNIFINKGHIFTPKPGPVGPCLGKCISDIDEAVSDIKIIINKKMPEKLEEIDDTKFDPLWYNSGRAGNKQVILKAEFSFRKDKEYRVEGFELFEDRWQQLARISGQDMDTWEEKPVKNYGGDETWPFPGKAKLIEEDVFVTQDFTIVEKSGGGLRDKDRGSGGGLAGPYSSPKFGEPKKKKIAENYKIIKP